MAVGSCCKVDGSRSRKQTFALTGSKEGGVAGGYCTSKSFIASKIAVIAATFYVCCSRLFPLFKRFLIHFLSHTLNSQMIHTGSEIRT
ncbi:hypothetical protein BT96DRAFT_579497 [Gymnopus androsaceus JB14]|uniref:Uncharacterized protein n=1 Tax=Gymnopus androsaceus JB14 TaxID=1447944 RepID=A0A6A4IGI7_9AGAR|nr:hypothetical protein BT96DRAFT_579497 [Gymnopus androsaceus JB14]